MMIKDPEGTIDEFHLLLSQIGLCCGDIQHEAQPCPHKPHGLPVGKCTVYVFSLSEPFDKPVLSLSKGSGERKNVQTVTQEMSLLNLHSRIKVLSTTFGICDLLLELT